MPDSEQMQKVLDVIKWVQGNLELERFNPKTYSRIYGRRSVAQIIKSGKVPYIYSCPDIAMTLTALLKEAGFNPTFVAHEYIVRNTTHPLAHFALEIKVNGRLHTINPDGISKIQIYRGRYDPAKSKPGRKNLAVSRVSTEKLNRGTNLLGLFGIKNYKDLNKRFKHFKYAQMRHTLSYLRKADGPKLFERRSAQRRKIIRL